MGIPMKKYIFLCVLLCVPLLRMCAETEAESAAATYHFELPVNWSVSPKYNLEVTIPSGYTSLQPFDSWSDKTTTLIEFVPKGETGEDWSEIISINKFIGSKVNASDFAEALKKRMLASVENGKVLDLKKEKKPSYTFSAFFLSYDLNGKHEMMGARYFSGPDDLVGVQYTIRPDQEMSDKEALAKIKTYFTSSTSVKN